jgi:hypothetical protein
VLPPAHDAGHLSMRRMLGAPAEAAESAAESPAFPEPIMRMRCSDLDVDVIEMVGSVERLLKSSGDDIVVGGEIVGAISRFSVLSNEEILIGMVVLRLKN